MAWKLREGKKPPKEWLALLIEFLQRAHKVPPSRELVERLYPLWVQLWQEGATYREVGKATCACEKGQIIPSPGVLVEVKKGEVKPPRNAKPGEIFGAEDLRRTGAPKSAVKPAVYVAKPAAPKRPVKGPPKRPQPKAPPPAPSQAPPAPRQAPPAAAPPPVVPSTPATAQETERELMSFVDSLGDDE